MTFNKNDLVETKYGRGVIDTPGEKQCLVMFTPKVNPGAKAPCEFKICLTAEIEKVEE